MIATGLYGLVRFVTVSYGLIPSTVEVREGLARAATES